MKTKLILATVLATAMSASFAAAPTANLNHDAATYRNVTQKAAADYKAAIANCDGMSGNAKMVCTEEAKVARARADADAVAAYNNTAKGRIKARASVADADYALAKVKCAEMVGADKDTCMNNAKSVHVTAMAEAKADRNVVAATGTTSATKAAAIDKCAQIAGNSNTGCLIDNKGKMSTLGTVANRTEANADHAAHKTGAAVDHAAHKTGAAVDHAAHKTGAAMDNAAHNTGVAVDRAADKTRNAAAVAADKTRDAAATVADKTRNVAANAADKTRDAAAVTAARTGPVVADTVITTKVKAEVFKEPSLKSMGIHVETEKGVVMLSGFVDSKADAAKAVKLAKSVEGVTSVKSAIKVK